MVTVNASGPGLLAVLSVQTESVFAGWSCLIDCY